MKISQEVRNLSDSFCYVCGKFLKLAAKLFVNSACVRQLEY